MASDGTPITLSVQSAQAGQTSVATTAKPADGKPSYSDLTASAVAATHAAASKAPVKAASSASVFAHDAAGAAPVEKTTPPQPQRDVGTLVTQLNKHLNDSGRPDQYRVDPQSSTTIQEINPANGAVIGQFSASEFPALARSAGASATGLLVDSLA